MSGGPLRILAVSLRYPPYVAGGYELVARDTVEDLRGRGHEVQVLTAKGARHAGEPDVLPWLEPALDGEPDLFRRSFEASNLERFRLHFLRTSNWSATRRAIADGEPDALLFFNLAMLSLAPILAARHAGLGTFGFLGDAWPANHWVLAWRENARSAATKPSRLAALERAWGAFRELVGIGPAIVPSAFLRAQLVAEGLGPEELEVVPHGLAPDMEALARASRPAERAPGEALRVVCTSSLWEGKGQDVLLRGVARAQAAGGSLEVALVAPAGDPEYRARLEELASASGIARAVRFVPRLERPALSELLASSHVLVTPSTWGEPFGLSTLEGMEHGLGVVTTDAGASPELVRHGESGLVVPAGDPASLGDALLALERDEPLRRSMGARARERARAEFSHTRFVDGIERGLRRAAGGAAS